MDVQVAKINCGHLWCNSCLYTFTGGVLESPRNRIGQRPLLFELDRLKASGIVEELDLGVAEVLHRERENLE